MKKYFLLFLFGIACSGTYSQIDTSSFNYNFVNLLEDIDVVDSTTIEFGQVSFQISLTDTLQLSHIQIQVDDNLGHPIVNILELKSDLYASQELQNGLLNYTIPNYFRTDKDYVFRLVVRNISNSSEVSFSETIIKQ